MASVKPFQIPLLGSILENPVGYTLVVEGILMQQVGLKRRVTEFTSVVDNAWRWTNLVRSEWLFCPLEQRAERPLWPNKMIDGRRRYYLRSEETHKKFRLDLTIWTDATNWCNKLGWNEGSRNSPQWWTMHGDERILFGQSGFSALWNRGQKDHSDRTRW